MFKKSDAQLLFDLNESLRTLFNTLCPSANNQVVFRDETWIHEIDPENRKIADFLLTKVIDVSGISPSVLLTTLRERWILSIRPDLDSSGIRNAIIDIAKVFIWTAESGLSYGIGILNFAVGSDVLSDDDFEYRRRTICLFQEIS